MTQLSASRDHRLVTPVDHWQLLEGGLAFVLCAVIGTRFLVYPQITAGYLVSFALAPMTIRAAWRIRAVRTTLVTVVVCVVVGLGLVTLSGFREVNPTLMVVNTVELVGVAATALAVLWAMQRIGPGWATVGYCVGYLAFVNQNSDLYSTNPWRFGYAVPVSLLVVALAALTKSLKVEVFALATIVVLAAVSGGRSSLATKLVALLLIAVWLLRAKQRTTRTTVLSTVVILAMIAWTVKSVVESLLLDGILGEQAQARSQAQEVASGGSLLLGGRPELGATVALMVHRVIGFGLGVLPSWSDIEVGRGGMASVGYDPNSGYVDHYMFGGGFRLHSMVGDLWTSFGLAGVALAVVIGWHCFKAIAQGPSRQGGNALILVCSVQTLWNLVFSPWYSSISVMTLLVPLMWYRLAHDSNQPYASASLPVAARS